MLAMMQQLPRVQWMITTLGKRGSVLLERQHSEQTHDSTVLEDQLNAMLHRLNRSNTAGDNLQPADGETADCISKNGTPIRLASCRR